MKKVITLTLVLYAISFFGQEKPLNLKRGEVTEDYFGRKVTDPYRTIENVNDSIVENWFKNESKHANDILDKISVRDSLLDKLINFSNRRTTRIKNVKVTKNEEYFYLKHNKENAQYELYYRKSFDAGEEFLYSPVSYREDLNRGYTINYINPSWDGKKVAVAMSYKGKELSDVVIIDVKKKEVLPEVITQAWPKSFFGINWLPDNSGFTYLYFPVKDGKDKNFKRNTEAVLYRLGENPINRKILLSKETHPHIVEKSDDYPCIAINSSNDKYLIAYMVGVDNYWNAFYGKMEDLEKGEVVWYPLFKKSDKVYGDDGVFQEDSFIYKSAKNNSNFEIAKIDILDKNINFDKSKVLVEEDKEAIIDNFIVVKDQIFFTTIKNGVEANLYKLDNGVKQKIRIPYKSGKIDITNIYNNEKFLIKARGWLNDPIDYYYQLNGGELIEQDFVTNTDFPEFKDIVVEEVEVPSHDGVLVPLTIIYNKGIKYNGETPVLIRTYGAYGSSYTPYFSYTFLGYVSEGGIFAIAHVRGGGEKGDTWHKGGYKTTKPNSWKDLIACTEYLIDKGFTSAQKVAITSGSAGGITIGRAMTTRPDLFGAVISQVGQMNPMRNEFRPGGGGGNYKEYGTIKDSIECMALIEMDPYLNIKDKGVNYPATLLTAGANDPRIPVWVPGKFAARLKASDTKNPVLFQVDYNSGHYGADSDYEYYKQWANIFSFAFWQTGHPDYQLKK